jgi:hypothetical protein
MTGNIWIDLQMSLVRPCQAVRKPVAASTECGEATEQR